MSSVQEESCTFTTLGVGTPGQLRRDVDNSTEERGKILGEILKDLSGNPHGNLKGVARAEPMGSRFNTATFAFSKQVHITYLRAPPNITPNNRPHLKQNKMTRKILYRNL